MPRRCEADHGFGLQKVDALDLSVVEEEESVRLGRDADRDHRLWVDQDPGGFEKHHIGGVVVGEGRLEERTVLQHRVNQPSAYQRILHVVRELHLEIETVMNQSP